MNFYKQLIISYFFVVLKNLILIFSKMISYVNKSFRTKFFLFSSVNDKSFEKFISSIQISDIQIMVEKSIINESNESNPEPSLRYPSLFHIRRADDIMVAFFVLGRRPLWRCIGSGARSFRTATRPSGTYA